MENKSRKKILNICLNKIHPGVVDHFKINIRIAVSHGSAYAVLSQYRNLNYVPFFTDEWVLAT